MNPAAKLIPVAIILVLVFIALQGVFTIVESGHVGVVRTLGAVQEKVLPEGFHMKKPFMDSIEQIDIRLNATQAAASAASKDLQLVSTKVTTQYSLNGEMAWKTFQRVGDREKVAVSIISPAIQESVKSVTAQFTAEQLVTQREQVKLKIQEAIGNFINVTLREKDLIGAVNVANVAITDFDFSQEFNRAIELKVKAEQEAQQAKNEKVRRVTQAEASAEEQKLAASAQAFQIEAESVARAEAIKREAEALRGNPALIQLRMVEKWDGSMPRFSGATALPMFDITNLDRLDTPANPPERRTPPPSPSPAFVPAR